MSTHVRIAIVVSVIAFALYAYTAQPDVGLVDSGELALVCATGGVPHPPGVPLYLMLGSAATKLPGVTPARALNLLSALLMALAAGAVSWSASQMSAIGTTAGPKRRGDNVLPWIAPVAGLFGAAVFFTSYNPWTWAGVTEVYALNVLLSALAWGGGAYAVSCLALPGKSETPWKAITFTLFVAFLGLANHHATTLPTLVGLFVWMAIAVPALLRSLRFWITTLAALTLPLSLYLVLLWVAPRDPVLNWGGIESLELLWRHIRGAQYSDQAGSGEALPVVTEFWKLLFFGCGIPAALTVVVGCPLLGLRLRAAKNRRAKADRPKRDRAREARASAADGPGRAALGALVALGALILANLFLSANYVAGPEDRMAYDLPATIGWSILAAVGLATILVRFGGGRSLALGALATVLAVTWNVATNWDRCNLHNDTTARTYTQELLEEIPRNSLVITSEWNFYAPYLYLKHVEGFRDDLVVIDVLMMRRFWYLDYLERAYPVFVERSRAQFEALREQVRLFDLGGNYDQFRIQQIYDELLRRWVEIGHSNGGSFVDWTTFDKPQEVSWLSTLGWTAHDLLMKYAPQSPDAPDPIQPKSRENIAFVESRLTEKTMLGDPSDLLPRHDPYRKVWETYLRAVEMSLQMGQARGGAEEVERLRESYQSWWGR